MAKMVKVTYNSETLTTTIVVDGKNFDTSRINGMEIADWADAFMMRKVSWKGFYEEMVQALDGQKDFDLVFEGTKEALAELQEAWKDAPVNVISVGERNVVIITYNAENLTTEITVNGKPFDTSRINGREIEVWVCPFMMRKVKWDGIFDELKNVLGTEIYEIQFSGTQEAMNELMAECPETVKISYQATDNNLNVEDIFEKANELYDNEDYTQAVEYYRQAAEMGYAPAQCYLGDCYDEGEGVKEDKSIAVKWYRKAAEQNYAEGQRDLGLCYYYGDGVPQNYEEAVKWLSLSAEQNDAIAQCFMGKCYQNGTGVNKDNSKAFEYFRKSAEQNNPEGMFEYALCIEDFDQCLEWLQKAIDAGNENAVEAYEYIMGDDDNVASEPDNSAEKANELENQAYQLADEGKYEEAFQLRLQAGEMGNVCAISNLGWHYEYGKGVEPDAQKAFSYYKKAAEMGSAWSQRKTGICYEDGFGVEQDTTEAFK